MVYLPLALMLLLSIISVAYVNAEINEVTDGDEVYFGDASDGINNGRRLVPPSQVSGGGGSTFTGSDDGYADSTGHYVVFSNGTLCGEAGVIGYSQYAMIPISWNNGSSSGDYVDYFGVWRWHLYQVVESSNPSLYEEYTGSADTIADAKHVNDMTVTFALAQSGFVVGLVFAGIAMFAVLGLNVLGSGLNSTGTRAVAALVMFGGLWVALSSVSVPALTGGVVMGFAIPAVPLVGWLVYLGLTFVYSLGVYEVVNGA